MSTVTSPDARYFTSDVEDGVYYPSSDGKPMAETGIHVTAILMLYQALEDFFRGRDDVYLAANMFWYWEKGNPKARRAPDVMVVTGVPAEFNGYPKGMRAGQMPGVHVARSRKSRPSQADMFLVTFGKPARELVCECERSTDTTLGQTFQLISGPELSKLLDDHDNRIGRLIESGKSDSQIITELYWAALTRAPSEMELKVLTNHVQKARDGRAGIEDALWAILNAKEFILRQWPRSFWSMQPKNRSTPI